MNDEQRAKIEAAAWPKAMNHCKKLGVSPASPQFTSFTAGYSESALDSVLLDEALAALEGMACDGVTDEEISYLPEPERETIYIAREAIAKINAARAK